MAKQEHVDVVLAGYVALLKWRSDNPGERLDLTGVKLNEELRDLDLGEANLCGADLSGSNLTGANLERADLVGGNLWDCRLYNANLQGACFREADLRHADLTRANCSGAEMRHTNLRYVDAISTKFVEADFTDADLTGAMVNGARFDGALFGGTILCDVDLGDASGLETSVHIGGSSVGMDTIWRSKGLIPSEFLEGCGVPEWMVSVEKLCNPELSACEVSDMLTVDVFDRRARGPLFLGGVFISYAHEDAGVAGKLCRRLKDEGARVWLDKHEMVAGSVEKQITKGIRFNDVVVVILSKASLKSEWVWDEIRLALKKEKEQGRDVLCPVAVDDAWLSEVRNKRRLMEEMKERLILDFSKWKTKAFEPKFKRLLKGLKVNYVAAE